MPPEVVVAHFQAQYGGWFEFAFGPYSGEYYVIGVYGVRSAPDPEALAALVREYAAAEERWRAAHLAPVADVLTARSAA
ncbi:hypothetical protein LG943_09355 [Streptomonospora sp. S1-112]|uniref:Uncharacterized protein n=1 Tax=Streptomonospora mangrovi TaxID=2883123 RepID=A0A9X3NIW5_9ACTN|nr:hypothetical protein [Streptomonospora mangrovi]MDA0564532.1 hypothetical protein [Streptomonospora mangrovi]